MNNLFQQKTIEQQKKENLPLQFQMDTQNELDCVIFDEIHYINDKERGKIWEETIMMLPKHVLIVMLSATINGAEKFAQWIENVKQRDVWLASTTNRVVPLTHYSYITLRDKLAEKYGKTNSYYVLVAKNSIKNIGGKHEIQNVSNSIMPVPWMDWCPQSLPWVYF